MSPCNYDNSDVLFTTDLMYLSSTTLICHVVEKVAKSTTYSMNFTFLLIRIRDLKMKSYVNGL